MNAQTDRQTQKERRETEETEEKLCRTTDLHLRISRFVQPERERERGTNAAAQIK